MKTKFEKIAEVLSNFRDELGRPDLMIVGSLSLWLNGFDVEVNDIDIEAYDLSEEQIKKLRLLERANPIIYPHGYVQPVISNRLDFNYQGLKFNVWLKKSDGKAIYEKRKFTYFNYYMVSNVLSTISHMVDHNRRKDHIKVINLINQITILENGKSKESEGCKKFSGEIKEFV